jgi:hypothetical protein
MPENHLIHRLVLRRISLFVTIAQEEKLPSETVAKIIMAMIDHGDELVAILKQKPRKPRTAKPATTPAV